MDRETVGQGGVAGCAGAAPGGSRRRRWALPVCCWLHGSKAARKGTGRQYRPYRQAVQWLTR
jgi:hypothetical protein